MAYVTGSVANISALLTSIRDACTANGWTLSGDVLHKGACYVRVDTAGFGVRILGGTGIDGSNVLTGAATYPCYIGDAINGINLTYPMTVEVHINTSPDEVYVVVNYSTSYYQFMAWGVSDVPGLTGTGVWYYASRNGYGFGWMSFHAHPNGGGMGATIPSSSAASALFWAGTVSNNDGLNTSYIHSDVDGRGWQGNPAAGIPSSFGYNYPLLTIQPNQWNGETILLPYPVYVARTSGNKVTLVADLKHIRTCRIDYHEPGDIITLGPDKWKLYPWFKKDASARDGAESHSGTVAAAVRYTGP